MLFYAQLGENNICIGVQQSLYPVPQFNTYIEPEYDLDTGAVVSEITHTTRIVRVPVYTTQYIGKKYLNQGKWGADSDEILPYDETLEYGYVPPVEVVVEAPDEA